MGVQYTPILKEDVWARRAKEDAELSNDQDEDARLAAKVEKNDMNERLKKIRERLIAIGNETDLLQAELQLLIDWSNNNNK